MWACSGAAAPNWKKSQRDFGIRADADVVAHVGEEHYLSLYSSVRMDQLMFAAPVMKGRGRAVGRAAE